MNLRDSINEKIRNARETAEASTGAVRAAWEQFIVRLEEQRDRIGKTDDWSIADMVININTLLRIALRAATRETVSGQILTAANQFRQLSTRYE